MKIIANLLFFLILYNFIYTQDSTDYVVVTSSFKFNDGLFLNFGQVKNNSPVPKNNIATELDKNTYDFYDMLIYEDEFAVINENGVKNIIKPTDNKPWGYAQNGKLFIYWEQRAFLIPNIGTISYFVASHYEPDFSYSTDEYFASTNDPSTKVELIQYFLYFPTGDIYEFTIKNIDPIFATDNQLYAEWSKLSKRKKKQNKFVYMRKFNEKHPLKLPK